MFISKRVFIMEMEIKKINIEQKNQWTGSFRPETFDEFIGQDPIKKVLTTAIESAKKRQGSLWHILFAWQSGFGKTTMANIIAKQMQVWVKIVTAYAINKPSEIVSILNSLEPHDILFIDEIHRLKPTVEEVLYIAMEDFVIDMVMPEWWNIRIPINPFTLIGATTKPEKLSQPMKNRFIYQFHFMDYTFEEKKIIIERYLKQYELGFDKVLLEKIAKNVDSVPREIHNLGIKLRDFCISKNSKNLTDELREQFLHDTQIKEGGLTPLHQQYLDILAHYDRPLGVKTIAAQMGVNEKSLEEDVEPLLLKLGKIEKTPQGRVLL